MDVSQGQKGRCLAAPGAKKCTGKQGAGEGAERLIKIKERKNRKRNKIPCLGNSGYPVCYGIC